MNAVTVVDIATTVAYDLQRSWELKPGRRARGTSASAGEPGDHGRRVASTSAEALQQAAELRPDVTLLPSTSAARAASISGSVEEGNHREDAATSAGDDDTDAMVQSLTPRPESARRRAIFFIPIPPLRVRR
jgi:hypothetical protein